MVHPPHERLFVEGLDVEEAVLQRGQTDSAIGGYNVGVTNGPVPIFTLQSPPVEQPIEAQVFMSVYFSAVIEGGGGLNPVPDKHSPTRAHRSITAWGQRK